ncbi:P-loop containing nucleoside triphosphate hydrolase protein [Mycena maculata]|uniref:P-loop containing nucleoside triphosphate hydrolase protein n=1 Tax=Mycena maculata TaxID=230809 RepID=A0AAD7IY68_9AGAR|nr:P-loop containing nucleoside triphosphate hydrolase protein [Mycena maculata]
MKARKKELDALNEEYKDVAYGSKAELVHLDKRWDKNGDEYYIRQKKVPAIRTAAEGGNWWEKHILVVIRHFYHHDNEHVHKTSVEVYSGHLRKILAKVISYYPGISFHTQRISLILPAECLYHYLSELRAEAQTLQEGSIELEHLNILLNFIETQFAATIEEVNNLLPQGLISYGTLWTLFRPGTITHSKIRGYDRAFKLQSYNECAGFYQTGTYVDYDGQSFGTRQEQLKIPPFEGSTHISALPFAPLEMRARKDEIRMALMKRGKKFQTMRGQCHGEYVGVAIEQEQNQKFSINGRVMIDGTSYNRFCADFSWEADDDDEEAADALFWAEGSLSAEEFAVFKADQAAKKAARGLTDEETLLATNVLRGFSFTEKKWFQLFIENFSEIKWNEASFDRLVLPESSKTLIRALVSSQLRAEGSKFDDIIKGKGRGLVTVLHGPPGVGKTLTAECIAEYTHRPLYVVSSGDLGTSASRLERELTRILDLAHTWKAILLIDEADVFLEKRTLTDVDRNALVSVFLRLLEYYEGILFLTTNRVNTFDPAFQSRIHMALKYENLEADARKCLWKDFLAQLKGGINISEEEYDALAQYSVNGRQIKNAIKTAESLASFLKRPLGLEDLETVLKTQAEFADAFVGNEY